MTQGWLSPAACCQMTKQDVCLCVANCLFHHSESFVTSSANAAHGFHRDVRDQGVTGRSDTKRRESECEPILSEQM